LGQIWESFVKKFVIAISALAASTVGAFAADMAARPYTKAPPLPPAPIYSWGGFYVGANVGGAWARSNVTDVNGFASGALPGTVTSIDRSGFLGGGQIGYNWQTGAFVFGIEGDGGWMDLGGKTLLTGTSSNSMVGLRSAAYGDITGRAGYAFDRALLYVKGGYAVMDNAAAFSTNAAFTPSFSGTSTGYTVGGGVEYKITQNWSAKVEYMHFDFGHSLNYSLVPPTFPFTQTLRVETVKFGINYLFGGPVVAKY
jgi:outer membrane immunogenic protein